MPGLSAEVAQLPVAMEMTLQEQIALKKELYWGRVINGEEAMSPWFLEKRQGQTKPQDKRGEQQHPQPVAGLWIVAFCMGILRSLICRDFHLPSYLLRKHSK